MRLCALLKGTSAMDEAAGMYGWDLNLQPSDLKASAQTTQPWLPQIYFLFFCFCLSFCLFYVYKWGSRVLIVMELVLQPGGCRCESQLTSPYISIPSMAKVRLSNTPNPTLLQGL